MFIIGEAIVEEEIAVERFACDCSRCHGACCTLPGGRGAPLTDDETDEIKKAFPFAKGYLSGHNLDVISSIGMVEGSPGRYYTVCIEDKDCVFVYYEGGVARCALEKAYLDGLTKWRKPISCHLFPIRVGWNGAIRLRYERIPECLPGKELGTVKDVPLYEYLKEPLIRSFGEEWYREFHAACTARDAMSRRKSE